MEVKMIELRDRQTFIPCIAIRLQHRVDHERFLLRRAGYGAAQIHPESTEEPYIILGRVEAGSYFNYDPFNWEDRTFTTAHNHIIAHWPELKTGDVVDVEFILGESATKKESEYLSGYNI
jgi:hypothetical protein